MTQLFLSHSSTDDPFVRDLRAALAEQYPATYARIEQRRRFMTETLGFVLPPEVLPLADLCGIVPPYLFEPNTLIAPIPQTSAPPAS